VNGRIRSSHTEGVLLVAFFAAHVERLEIGDVEGLFLLR
jgi:hypothetical protein